MSKLENFITKVKIIHGDKYDYSLVEYVKSNIKIKINCYNHGIFEQRASNHLQGDVCPKCSRLNSICDFIKTANLKHNNKYDYSLVIYNGNNIKINIICPIHGEFKQIPNNHLNGKGCPVCCESKGEKEIKNILLENKINFIQQQRFSDCKFKYTLPFDFYLPDYNTCIEFNGRQHYVPITKWGGLDELTKIQCRDKIKSDYCFYNNIYLIIIKHDEIIINKLKNLINLCIRD